MILILEGCYTQNFMACGASFLVRENLAPRYLSCILSLSLPRMAESTSFWSFFLASEVVLFGAFSAKNLWDLVLLALASLAKVSSATVALTPETSTLRLVLRV